MGFLLHTLINWIVLCIIITMAAYTSYIGISSIVREELKRLGLIK